MPYDFKLPDLGEGLTQGEIVAWKVKEGDVVKVDQPLLDVMTDKATVEIPSPRAGRIAKIHAAADSVVKVGEPLVTIDVEGAPALAPPAPPLPAGDGGTSQRGEASSSKGKTTPPSPAADAGKEAAPAAGPVLATPAVRRLAKELGVDLARVRGSGPGGRVEDADVRAAAGGGGTAAEERVPLKGVRKRMAERLAESHRRAVPATLMDEADLTDLVALWEALQPEAAKRGVRLTYLAFFLRAVALALRKVPVLNAVFDEARSEIILKKRIHLSVAVASPEGLVAPVLKDAGEKDLWSLALALQALVDRAREGRLSPEDLHGGTFTVTNIGPLGGMAATPVLNPPETGILAVGRVSKRPAVRDGKIVARDLATLSLTIDHRAADGADAAGFLADLIRLLGDPKGLVPR